MAGHPHPFLRTQCRVSKPLAERDMRSLLIASPPPQQFVTGLLIGLVIVAMSVGVFLRRKPDLGWRRLLGLCVLAFVLGPLAGTGVAVLTVVFGDVHPLDRRWLVSSFIIVGTVAGVIVAVLMGSIGTIQVVGLGCSGQHEHGGTAGKRCQEPLPTPTASPTDAPVRARED